jgi:guanine nucleotide-binding protein G(i) subunit alpha
VKSNLIVFVASLSDYNKLLYEDHKTNRMEDSLTTFEEIINNSFFKNSTIVLLLNKYDIFKEKIDKFPLQEYFPEYKGGNEESAYEFIKQMYLDKDCNGHSREIIVNKFVATNNIESIKGDLKDILNKLENIFSKE